jgi:dTDP-4-amino-4,6-dideoxygalactose transaminase
MPAFQCGLEVRAALDAGRDVRFYRVTDDLQVDEDDLRTRLQTAPGPVYVIHYFGFPQRGLSRIAQWCREASQPLIEDCAHALFSKAGDLPLGCAAPLAVFSLGKTLGAIGGGALRADPRMFRDWTGEPFVSPPALSGSIRRDLAILRSGFERRLSWGTASPPTPDSWSADGEERPYRWPVSSMTRRLLAGADIGRVVSRRRANWLHLDRLLSERPGYEPLHRELPEGCCPLVLTIRTRARDRLRATLLNAGIHPYLFGAVPHPFMPERVVSEAAWMRDEILGLPVHQELDSSDVEFIAEATILALNRSSSD